MSYSENSTMAIYILTGVNFINVFGKTDKILSSETEINNHCWVK